MPIFQKIVNQNVNCVKDERTAKDDKKSLEKELLSQLHEQYAINDNDKSGKIIQFVGVVAFLLVGYGFVIWHYEDHKSVLFPITLAASVVLTLLALLCVNFGYCTRRDQFIAYRIRKYAFNKEGYEKVFSNMYSPYGKVPVNFLPGYYFIFFICLIFFILSINLYSSYIDKKFSTCYYSTLTVLLSINFIYYCYAFIKYDKMNKANMKDKVICNHLVKVFNSLPDGEKPVNEKGVLRVKDTFSLSELDSCVVLQSGCYENIFGRKKKDSGSDKKRLSVVKITYNGTSIHRNFKSIPADGFNKEDVGLTIKSIQSLNAEDFPKNGQLILEKGCWFTFYWQHPDNATRLSMKSATVSLLIAIISLIIALISML